MKTAHAFLDLFFQAYLDAALWSSMDENQKPLDGAGYGVQKVAPETLKVMEADCLRFYTENSLADLNNREIIQAGHDFWLTRCGHGCGFWDGDWQEPQASLLTVASQSFGHVDLYVGDDGLIYCSPNQPAQLAHTKEVS